MYQLLENIVFSIDPVDFLNTLFEYRNTIITNNTLILHSFLTTVDEIIAINNPNNLVSTDNTDSFLFISYSNLAITDLLVLILWFSNLHELLLFGC